MTETDRLDFGRVMAGLAEVYDLEVMSEQRCRLYFDALSDLPLEAVQTAAEMHVRTSRFFPRPAELRDLAGDTPPDAGLVEALLVAHLREPNGERRVPTDAFLALVCERLGGVHQAAGMDSAQRVFALAKVLPGVVGACRARRIPLPLNAPSADVLRLAARAGQPALPQDEAPLRLPPTLAATLPQIGRRVA